MAKFSEDVMIDDIEYYGVLGMKWGDRDMKQLGSYYRDRSRRR